jgi:hypothetical protein
MKPLSEKPTTIELGGLPDELQSALEVLRNLELEAGNLQPVEQKEKITQLSSLQEKIEPKTALAWDLSTGDKADVLFAKICCKLKALSHEPEAIANFVNEQLTAGDSLKYCNKEEVLEAIQKVGVSDRHDS